MPLNRILPASDRALLVDYGGLERMLKHFAALQDANLAGVTELVPAAQTLLVQFDPSVTNAVSLAAAIRQVAVVDSNSAPNRSVEIDVLYDGEDLHDVAELLAISTDELVARHSGAEWKVAFTGFAPGFAYCVSNDPLFQVPRRSSPRTRIPAGALALAAEFSGIYPRESPGGWQLIGRTAEPMWDLERTPPALLSPGDAVKYRPVREFIEVERPGVPEPSRPERALEVVQPGLQLLVQDLGRPGMLNLGVPASGAADRRGLRAANRIVGNRATAAAFEIASGGVELKAHVRAVAAYAGASGRRELISANGERYPFPRGVPVALEPGDRIRISGFTRGMRGYLAVRGGIKQPKVLGSRATDTLSGIGPEPLKARSFVTIGPDHSDTAVGENDLFRPDLPAVGEVVTLDVTLGPRTDWFTKASIDTLLNTEWDVTATSNRIGIRLHGDTPLERQITDELPSEGAVTGSIQVPADGQPVLFLADHPLTGGYPIIAALVDRDIDLAGQLPPGSRVRFRSVADFAEL